MNLSFFFFSCFPLQSISEGIYKQKLGDNKNFKKKLEEEEKKSCLLRSWRPRDQKALKNIKKMKRGSVFK